MKLFGWRRMAVLTVVAGLVVAACGGGSTLAKKEPTTAPPASPEATAPPGTPDSKTPAAPPRPTRAPTPTRSPQDDIANISTFSTRGWKTDFTKHSVPFNEIISGGPPRDGIPSIDKPQFISVKEASEYLVDREPISVLELNGEVRAYPLQIMTWHEIVNDSVGGQRIAVTFCPLCNTAIVFDATLPDSRVAEFGTSGNLRFSDLVMYDRVTQSWWQQIDGEAIVGELTGARLKVLPSQIVSFEELKVTFPDAKVLSRKTGFSRPYGQNPYTGYDTGSPFLFRGPADDRLPATERVVALELGGEAAAFPFSVLEKEPVVHFTVGGQKIVVLFKQGTASALDDDTIAKGRDVGATGVFFPKAGDRELTFRFENGAFKDNETGSTWSLLGQAIAGPLKGQKLQPVLHANNFWFSWAVFKPDTTIYRGMATKK